MTKMLTNAKRTLIVYKLAIVRFALFVVQTLCGSIMAALAGTQWSQADGQTRFLIVTGIVASLTSTLGAFFDKTLSRLAPEAAPFVAPEDRGPTDFPPKPASRPKADPAEAFAKVQNDQLPP